MRGIMFVKTASSHRAFICLVYAAAFSAALVVSTPLYSQDTNAELLERLGQLESQIEVMRQYRAREDNQVKPVRTNVPVAGAARFEVELAQVQEELRFMRGRMEEMEFEQRRVADEFNKLQQDMDARMAALEAGGGGNATPPVIGGDEATSDPSIQNDLITEVSPTEDTPEETPEAATPAPEKKQSRFSSAREHYDAAFKSLNQSDYNEAQGLFESFLKAYPKDVLVGNAYYWLGETYYVQRKFSPAAERFRLGFEAMPDGPKAPDNLLKLAMSLSTLERKKEACVVLGQLRKKYAEKSSVILRKANKESAKLQCS